jgi:hypothetical protein
MALVAACCTALPKTTPDPKAPPGEDDMVGEGEGADKRSSTDCDDDIGGGGGGGIESCADDSSIDS